MRKAIIICLVLGVFTAACNQKRTVVDPIPSETISKDSTVNSDSASQTQLAFSQVCKSDSLIFEDAGISSYTEDSIRGTGVISFQLDVNNRLDFYDMDGPTFGFLVLNEDMTYYTLDMPQKTTARKVIPEFDFAALDFDAEPVNSDKDYLFIYVNKEKRKVKKAGMKYKYYTWPEYLRGNTINLKPCNLLKAADGSIIKESKDQYFNVTAVKGDMIEIKSTKGCQTDFPYKDMQGWVKWRSAEGLVIDFAVCD